ncbi:RsmD family RNA methyltransferase [Streptomyces sp. NPDC056670]|uniref:RsmD family RNA methyltransferase n=1 Tax=Streptomyces sp. NPDC056670 TaxID=3345904 RepID=UPI003680E058
MSADLTGMRSQVHGDTVVHTFANGLTVTAEPSGKRDRLRILPLTRLQGALLNHLVRHPSKAERKTVFEPFAGSGAFGFMALALGAERADFLDINPRAADFHSGTATANGFPATAFRSVTGDLRDFAPEEPYDLVLANPPFLPTPDCITGTLNSNGGPDGNTLLDVLLERLPALLKPEGEALVILYQLVRDGIPLAAAAARARVPRRPVEFTPLQDEPVPLARYAQAYEDQHPAEVEGIRGWRNALERTHGPGLTLAHYVMHLGSEDDTEAFSTVRDNAAEKFGSAFLIARSDPDYMPVDGRRH